MRNGDGYVKAYGQIVALVFMLAVALDRPLRRAVSFWIFLCVLTW